ncbi:hypothetical protein GCM10023107_51090 [Actinoplanes octamycinicus]|nr:hypothetical protein Aoc01nite_04550 [Actinoplanes octamycinicus]
MGTVLTAYRNVGSVSQSRVARREAGGPGGGSGQSGAAAGSAMQAVPIRRKPTRV